MSIDIFPEEIIAVLRQFNPWWLGERIPELPEWKRPAFRNIVQWFDQPEVGRALLLTGPRQVGKTTLFRQGIQFLLDRGIPPENILYATFDHPLLNLIGQEKLLQIWREYIPPKGGASGENLEYIFFDEFQSLEHWSTWLKHQVDFQKSRRIAVTGSSASLLEKSPESGVGRWLSIRLPTLSFYEYLQIRNENPLADSDERIMLKDFKALTTLEREHQAENARKLTPYFHQYLIRGGFPECAKIESIQTVQRLLREDIIDKILKRDMSALFGVRQIHHLERLFLYLCLHDGAIFEFSAVCESLEIKRPTAEKYLGYFESSHLLSRLRQFGYGKEVLRGRSKFYLADPSIASAVFLRGMQHLEDPSRLGAIVESVVYKHLAVETFYSSMLQFSYWRGKNDLEVDIIAELPEKIIPFEIKYRSKEHTQPKDIRGLMEFCRLKNPVTGYLITKAPDDIETIACGETTIIKIPAPLACYLLGRAEHPLM